MFVLKLKTSFLGISFQIMKLCVEKKSYTELEYSLEPKC